MSKAPEQAVIEGEREARNVLRTVRDYVADAASGRLSYDDSADGFAAMAKGDLARIDAALASKPTSEGEQLTADMLRVLPGGVMDDSTYVAIEDALDEIEAPSVVDGKWLSLVERIQALSTPAQAEPVAYLYTKQGHLPRLAFSVQPEAREADWTETPLYAAPQPAPVADEVKP